MSHEHRGLSSTAIPPDEPQPVFWWGLGFILCFTVPLLAHAYTGFSTRYLADDYCFALIARTQGLLYAQRHHYLNWRGVFSHSFVASLAGLNGPRLVPYLPASVLGLWFLVTAWATAQLPGWRGCVVRV